MFRWTEQKDCYRLDVSHGGTAALHGCLAVSLGTIFAAVALIVVFASKRSETPLLGVLVMAGIVASIVWYCWSSSRAYARAKGWIEISIRGGTARWGDSSQPGMASPVHVSRFEAAQEGRQGFSIEALLPGGERRRALGPWTAVSMPVVQKTVLELNANLGTVESSEATVVPPPVNVPQHPSVLRLLETWSRIPGPYRVEVRDRVRPLILLILVAWLLYTAWTGWREGKPVPLYNHPLTACIAFLAFYFGRTRWVEVARRGGLVRWGTGTSVTRTDVQVLAFEPEPVTRLDAQHWTLAAVLENGERQQVFRWPNSMAQGQAITFAHLLNWALQPPESAQQPPSA